MSQFIEQHPWIFSSILLLCIYVIDTLLVSLRDAKFPEIRRKP